MNYYTSNVPNMIFFDLISIRGSIYMNQLSFHYLFLH